jgi:hypothetical protein
VQPHAGAAATADGPRLLSAEEQAAAKRSESSQRDEKRALEERMDAIAARWRERARAEGRQVGGSGVAEEGRRPDR